MKKQSLVADLGGAPFTKEDMRTVFNDELWDAMESILYAYNADTEGLIISGCEVTGGGPYNIAAGIVYLNGEFMRLPAATGQTLPKYIAPAAAVNDTRTFADSTSHALFITKAAELVGSAPGAGQYVAITTATDSDDRRWIPIAASVKLRTKILLIGDWDMDATGNLNVTHGLPDFKKIRGVDVVIRDDADTTYYNLPYTASAGTAGAGVNIMTSTVINLARVTGGNFDSTSFDSTGYNRGWVTITYEA